VKTGITSDQIKAQARVLGFEKVGIVAAEALTAEGEDLRAWLGRQFHGKMEYMARTSAMRVDPRELLPSARSVVSVALNYFRPEKHSDDPAIGKISRYAWGDDYHDVLRDKLKALLAWIAEREPSVEGRICIDSAPAMDKAWAVRAGLGWIGKHTNLITKEYGSWVFLGELLLSIELDCDTFIEPDHCGTCTACIEACPTDALIAPYQIDARRCISYGTIELRDDELPEPINSNLEGWVFGCDICQDVCPWSRFSKETNESRFEPRPGIIEPRLDELREMTAEEFAARFRRSPVKRAKAAGLRRNAEAAGEERTRKARK
jgi:epoxyqueuosine reductase